MNYYSRGTNFLTGLPAVTKVLLIINVIIFITDLLLTPLLRGSIVPNDPRIRHALSMFLGLKSYHSGMFEPYQIITHMFAHGSFMHILFNMFGLVMFGRVLETVLGSKKFFTLYFLSGLGSAGLQFFIYYIFEVQANMVGASGAVFGILAAFTVMFPNVELMIIFFPVPIKAKYLVPGILGLGVLLSLFGRGGNIAHFAHLGGAIVGFILVMIWKKNQFKVM
jgi:membrane associated rhomboid family serine protease